MGELKTDAGETLTAEQLRIGAEAVQELARLKAAVRARTYHGCSCVCKDCESLRALVADPPAEKDADVLLALANAPEAK